MIAYSIIQKSQLEGAHRLDAEYYQPEYLEIIEKIQLASEGFQSLKQLGCKVVSGPFGSSLKSEAYIKQGVPLIRISDLSDFFIEQSNLVYISPEDNDRLKQSKLFPSDLVISKVGHTIGIVSAVPDEFQVCNISENNIGIKFIDRKINIGFKSFLLTFLNSRLGFLQIIRKISGNAQPKLNIQDINEIIFPLPKKDDIKQIYKKVTDAKDNLNQAKTLYTQAEDLILEELGLKDLKIKDDLSYVVNLSDVKSSHRVDAEYFQPKYERIENKLVKKCDAKKVKDLYFINVTTGQYCEAYVTQNEGKTYIRGTDISMGTIRLEDLYYIDPKKQISSKKAKEGDVVVTRVGTIGISARLPKEVEGGTISDNLIRMRFPEEQLDSYYVSLFFNTVGSQLMIRESRGSVQARLNQETLKEIVLPILPKPTQQKIANLVRRSHEARKKAKELLEEAKHKVEEMIEKKAG